MASSSNASQHDVSNSAVSLPESVRLTVEAALGKKATEPVLLDMRRSTDVADFFLICSADADIHAGAITDAVVDALKPIGRRPWHVEGRESLSWVLVDFVDVVVHVFRPEARGYYALEEIWADAERVDLSEFDLSD